MCIINNLKDLREKNGITQLDLARTFGVNSSIISRVEKGNSNLSPKMRGKYMKYFKCTPLYIEKLWVETANGKNI